MCCQTSSITGLPLPAAASAEVSVNVAGNVAFFLITVPPLVINVKVLAVPSPYNSRVTLPRPVGNDVSSGKFKNSTVDYENGNYQIFRFGATTTVEFLNFPDDTSLPTGL